MLTLSIVIYVVISLYFSIRNMRTTDGLFGDVYEAQKPKGAFIEGFSVIPVFSIIGGVIYGLLFLTLVVLSEASRFAVWLIEYAP